MDRGVETDRDEMTDQGVETQIVSRAAVVRMEIVDEMTAVVMTVVDAAEVPLVAAVATTVEDVAVTAVLREADEILGVAVTWVACRVAVEPFSHRAKLSKAPSMVYWNFMRAVTAS